MGLVQLASLVTPKNSTGCTICYKSEAGTFKLHVPLGPYIQEVILPLVMVILGFLTIPWLGPKDMEPRVPSVPKAKLGHTDHVRHRSQRGS